MRKTIGVVGLLSNENVGDYLLVDATKFLLRRHDPDLLLIDIDAEPYDDASFPGRRRLNLRASDLLRRFEGPLARLLPGSRLSYRYSYLCWWLRLGWHLDAQIRDLDALVVAGGGFIKFKTQNLSYLDEMMLKIARKRGIPVMMNAVGVEGYSETDARCQQLKRALNFENVRVITTRDDIDTLNDRYIVNPQTVTARVGDPVFWLRDMEMVDEAKVREMRAAGRRIGINLINPENFSMYGGRTSPASIANFYENLIAELQEAGADFSLFSNGMEVDQRFGERLVERMGLRPDQLIRCPETSAEFVDLVAGFDIILSARMHAGITAYALDVPVIGLIWGEKLRFLTELTGLKDRYFGEDELDPERIAGLLLRNDLPAPDAAVRADLRERTRRELAAFVDGLDEGGTR